MNQEPRNRNFRFVCRKSQIPDVESLLYAEGFEFIPSVVSDWMRRLTKEPKPLGSSLAAFFGVIYIQDELSLLAPLYLNPDPDSLILDMCASPGGKVGFLAQLLSDKGAVVANEPITKRFYLMRDNLLRMNLLNAATSRYPGEMIPLFPDSLSGILLDVPCSGWGTVYQRPENNIVQEDVRHLLNVQRNLLHRAAQILAPGGRILYSTCTSNYLENEEQVFYAREELGLNSVFLEEIPGLEYDTVSQGKIPGVLRVKSPQSCKGYFFVACLEKPEKLRQTDLLQFGQPPSPVEGAGSSAGADWDLDIGAEPDWDRLPSGKISCFQKRMVFLPQKALEWLPKDYNWWGPTLGRIHKNKLHLNPRIRMLLPPAEEGQGFFVSDIRELYRLLSGQSLCVSTGKRLIGLYWHNLPLGWLKVKGGRCLWSDRN